MISRPPSSRNQLSFYPFKQRANGHWCLKLPTYYAELFESQEKGLMRKSIAGWMDSSSGTIKCAHFADLTSAEIKRIESFIETYRKLVILDLNKNRSSCQSVDNMKT